MTILDTLANAAKKRVADAQKETSLDEIKEKALSLPKLDFEFEKALKKDDIAFICECKKASPSKGVITDDFPYVDIAKEYEAAGADCISVLTEPTKFLGCNTYLEQIAKNVTVPCIRKDFVVDEYMIYKARAIGAKAVLLICSILSGKTLEKYIGICESLGMSALVEVHSEYEAETAINAGARVIGVNTRDLKDFSVNTKNSEKLRKLIPDKCVFVSESGIKTAEDINVLREIGADAVLIGETLMRAADKKAKLMELKGKI